jgi:hypothetical protein
MSEGRRRCAYCIHCKETVDISSESRNDYQRLARCEKGQWPPSKYDSPLHHQYPIYTRDPGDCPYYDDDGVVPAKLGAMIQRFAMGKQGGLEWYREHEAHPVSSGRRRTV